MWSNAFLFPGGSGAEWRMPQAASAPNFLSNMLTNKFLFVTPCLVTNLRSAFLTFFQGTSVSIRLAAIDGDDGYTGVKPQHTFTSLVHCGTGLISRIQCSNGQ